MNTNYNAKKHLWGVLVGGVGGACILLSLGIWQIGRLHQKTLYIENIERIIHDAPIDLPAHVTAHEHQFVPITATGNILGDEIFIFAPNARLKSTYRVISVFATSGRRILLDQGHVPNANITDNRARTDTTITGNLHWPQEHDAFTPDPNLDTNVWYARDVPQMARALDTAPILLIQRTTTPAHRRTISAPVGTDTIVNNHLQYSITWFSLALIWSIMTVYFAFYHTKNR